MNYRESTDRIINTLRVNNVDQHISRRYVLSILKNITNQIISQKLLDRTIGLEMNLYSEISCKSCKSYSINHSKISTPDSSKSLPNINKLDMDLSIFAAPEVGILKNRCKSKKFLTAIHEADD